MASLHPRQSWEVRPHSLGWVRMGMLGDGTWYMVHGILLSFLFPDVTQPTTSGTRHGHERLIDDNFDNRPPATLCSCLYDCVGDACVASAWGDFLAPCVFHFIILVLMEAFCERYD